MTSIAFKKKVSMSFAATALLLLASGFVFAPSAFAASTEAATSGSYTIAIICISAALALDRKSVV